MLSIKNIISFFCIFFCSLCLNGQIIGTYAGTGTAGSTGDGGPATAARIFYPISGAFDKNNNYYFSEGSYGQCIREITPSGTILTVVGTGMGGFSGDGGPASRALLNYPTGIAIDMYNNLYISDATNQRIRKVNIMTGIITTIAGIGSCGYSGDNGSATSAAICGPQGLACDIYNNLYICDVGNERIRKIDTNGIITTVAGNGIVGYFGDGGLADSAEFDEPMGVACDSIGNIYIADRGNSRVRKINITSNIISTFAGNGGTSYTGDGVAATSTSVTPWTIAFDKIGNVYVCDYTLQRIRAINTDNIIHTIAGNGTSGYSGDGGLATDAEIYNPEGIAVDACGNIYIADDNNKRIRKITYPSTPTTVTVTAPTSAAIGSAVTLSAAITGGCCARTDSVIWMDKGVVFATTATPTVTFTKTMSTDSISAIALGCGDTAVSGVYVVTRNTTGLSGVSENQNGFTCYPNPAASQLYLSAGVDIESVLITDLLGQVVYQSSISNGQTAVVDVRQLRAGVYFVKVNNLWVEKFIKK